MCWSSERSSRLGFFIDVVALRRRPVAITVRYCVHGGQSTRPAAATSVSAATTRCAPCVRQLATSVSAATTSWWHQAGKLPVSCR